MRAVYRYLAALVPKQKACFTRPKPEHDHAGHLNRWWDDSFELLRAFLCLIGEVQSGAVRFWHFAADRGSDAREQQARKTKYTLLSELLPLPLHILVDVLPHLGPDLVRERKVRGTGSVLRDQRLGELRS